MTTLSQLRRPADALFSGDSARPPDAKTASGIDHRRPQDCVGEVRLPGYGAGTGFAGLV